MGFWKVSLIAMVTTVLLLLIPSYLKQPLPKVSGGFTAPGWERVQTLFRDNIESGIEEGGAFSVYHKGELVVDLYGGYADVESAQAWSKDSVSAVFSTVKGVSAIIVAMLVDRGLLDYDEPVATYWPEFAQNGKEKITLRQLVSHQAGLAVIHEIFHVKDIVEDPEKVSRILAEQTPSWEPGTSHGYHAFSLGLYIDQLIRRVDPQQRDIQQFFQEEVAQPFGIDFYIGLPLELNYRSTRSYPASLMSAVYNLNWPFFYTLFKIAVGIADNDMLKLSSNPEGWSDGAANNPYICSIPCGASRGFGTASGLAKLFSILATGGSLGGKRLLSERMIKEITVPQATGYDRYIPLNITKALGVNIIKSKLDSDMFGAPGWGGQMAFADRDHQISWVYLTNHQQFPRFGYDARCSPLVDAVYDIIDAKEKSS